MKNRILLILLAGFILLNISAGFHAYTFTHFSSEIQAKSKAEGLSLFEKAGILFGGISNPRPVNLHAPKSPYQTLHIKSGSETLQAWHIMADSAKGDVILCHGYGGEKSSMLHRARLIRKMGFNTLLLDFRGSGGSTGNTTTVGFDEAQDVVAAVRYLEATGRTNIFLLGTSMGAAATLKAVSEHNLNLKGIIVECPFASLLQTSKNRFEKMGVPAFPAAHLLVFWGGVENGFWGFGHSPAEYSKSVQVPTLLVFGEKDARVKRFEIDRIFENLDGEKELLLFPEAAHGDYLDKDLETWNNKVYDFLAKYLQNI